jgi:hypothetical protein
MFDSVIEFFIGTAPTGSEPIYYVFRCLIGLMMFDMILDVFRFARKFVMNKK